MSLRAGILSLLAVHYTAIKRLIKHVITIPIAMADFICHCREARRGLLLSYRLRLGGGGGGRGGGERGGEREGEKERGGWGGGLEKA